MTAMKRAAIVGVLVIGALGACGKKDGDVPPPPDERPVAPSAAPPRAQGSMTEPAQPSPAGEARKLFASRCATCHGETGRGDGAAAISMQPPPRNYSDPAWQASVTDDELAKIIVGGGPAVGKSSLMPPNNDLRDQPEVVTELVKLIRSVASR
jgi:mono/diheme cytochrome c family protein